MLPDQERHKNNTMVRKPKIPDCIRMPVDAAYSGYFTDNGFRKGRTVDSPLIR